MGTRWIGSTLTLTAWSRRAALPHAPVGGHVRVVAADRDLDVIVADERAPGWVDVDPAASPGPDLGPGMSRHLAGLVDVAADIGAGRPIPRAATDEQVSKVLANAPAQPECFADGRARSSPFLVNHPRGHRFSQSLDHRNQPALRASHAEDEFVELGRLLHQRAWLKIFDRFEGEELVGIGCPFDSRQPRLGRRAPVGRVNDSRLANDQFAVGRQDVKQIHPIAKPIAIDRDRCRGHDPQPIAQVRLILIRGSAIRTSNTVSVTGSE